jgi:hypothetical protein
MQSALFFIVMRRRRRHLPSLWVLCLWRLHQTQPFPFPRATCSTSLFTQSFSTSHFNRTRTKQQLESLWRSSSVGGKIGGFGGRGSRGCCCRGRCCIGAHGRWFVRGRTLYFCEHFQSNIALKGCYIMSPRVHEGREGVILTVQGLCRCLRHHIARIHGSTKCQCMGVKLNVRLRRHVRN